MKSLVPIVHRNYPLSCRATRLREALYSPAELLYGRLLPIGRIEGSSYRPKILSPPIHLSDTPVLPRH